METPPSNNTLKAYLTPPVGRRLRFFRRDWQTKKMLKQSVKHYYQWLHSTIHPKTKISQSSPDSLRIQGPSKRSRSGRLYPVSSVEDRNRKGGKCKISQVLQSPVSSPQASTRWRPVIDLSRLNTFLLIKRFKMETPESIRASDSRGIGVSNRPVRCLSSHPPKLKEVPTVLPQFTGIPVHLPPFWPSHHPTSFYNDCKGSEADGPHKGSQTSPIPGGLAYQGPHFRRKHK